MEKFDRLTLLPKGWDGYQGRGLNFRCARFAADLIERLYEPNLMPPQLVPGSDGSLQFEWHINRYDLEVDVLAPYNVEATLHHIDSGEFLSAELTTDFSLLSQWLHKVASSK